MSLMPDALMPLPERLIPKLAAARLLGTLPPNVHEFENGVTECVVCGSLTLFTWACMDPCWVSRDAAISTTGQRPVRYRV